ncbi:NAD(P)/FAD-dependent oxidoreductase [Zavarzinia compransoris]|uniref:FAD-dependent oxidoreductase n=1 Tax=Zavarzinia compransoris TaxID=1264899 RepID=A0A317E7D2_9PROT|nr:NAD(P)-binding protein [Zavarzinia compransoris]PWR22146.1 FAD-dependent oxidoreductase [Zavarzinia compransoris]TDP47103.1 hypothetical protein DES42_103273 [Zavarzinia compransoris]
MHYGPLVAVIGGGIAGQSAAAALSEAGALVTVFDKGRGAGGRLSTRRDGPRQWDHGAQYFTVRDPALKARVAALVAQGSIAPWGGTIGTLGPGGFVPGEGGEARFVGCPRMSALVGALGSGATVYDVELREIVTRGAKLTVTDRQGEHFGPYDGIVVATPAPQAVPLLALEPALATRVAAVEIAPCWALMLAFDAPLPLPFDGAFVDPALGGGMLAWIARDSSKPGRPRDRETWVVHAAPAWSAAHLDEEAETIAPRLAAAFAAVTGIDAWPATRIAHRWRHAQTTRPLGQPYLIDPRRPIGACGDWCLGARIEGAFLSGRAMGTALAERLGLRLSQASSSASQ